MIKTHTEAKQRDIVKGRTFLVLTDKCPPMKYPIDMCNIKELIILPQTYIEPPK